LELKKEKEKKDNLIGEVYGYILRESDACYLIDIETGNKLRINDFNGNKVVDGDVCRVLEYKGNKYVLNKIYTETSGNLSLEEEDKVKKVRNRKKKGTAEQYKGSIEDKKVILISGSQTVNYNKYFNGKVQVINPFEEGTIKILKEVDRADIILVRMDAVPHVVSDYIKGNRKEDTVFLTGSNVKKVGEELSKRMHSEQQRT